MTSNYNQRSGSSGSRRPSVSHPDPTSRVGSVSSRPRVRATQGGRPRITGLPEVSSTRIGDLNQRRSRTYQPEPEKTAPSKGRIVAIIAAVLAVLLAIGFCVARYSGLFPLRNISIQGVEHLTDDEINQLAAIPESNSIFMVDTEGIRNRLMQDTWIEDVRVNVVLPDTLEVVVKERTIAAVVEITPKDSGEKKQWAIASDGMWLMPIPDQDSDAGKATSAKVFEDANEALHITGVPYTAQAEMGKYCEESNVNNALGVVDGMTTELAGRVKTVIASDPNSTTLILDNGVEIAFGSSSDIRTKERVCLTLLKQYEGEIAYINVRTVDSPTWRSA